MGNLTLRQLRYFDALSVQRHFGRAADVCAVSQPALSVQIKELEQTLGTTLFERGHRQVRLTGFGETFSERVKDILRAVDELEDLARAADGTFAGRLRVGVIPTIAPYFLPTFVGAMSGSYPELDIRIREAMTERLIQELSDGQLDLAIVALPVSEETLTERPLFDENLVLVRPIAQAGHPLPTIDELREMRLLLLEEGHCFRDQALSFCNLQTAVPRDGFDGSTLSTLVQMVGAGMGVTLIPEMAIPVETGSAPVCVDRFEAPQPKRTVGMVWRKSNPLADQFEKVAVLAAKMA
ncbi:LysR substrate-binding domain-containing protein [Loktanella agnita]|uniref:LysR substrate-binding domain-containing protein n=1 Tax=Loktanella agnita TaxID=287097 RepID=UPI003986F83C